MIKNIILDIGDVLVKSNYHEFFIGKGCDKKTAQRLEKATFFTPAWKELDRGVWVFERIVDEFVKRPCNRGKYPKRFYRYERIYLSVSLCGRLDLQTKTKRDEGVLSFQYIR